MIFNSYSFLLVFLPLVLMGSSLLFRLNQGRGVIWFLALSSLLFYSAWNPLYLPLLLGSITVNYSCGRLILATSALTRRLVLIAGLLFNLGLLAYFKYADFFLESAHSLIDRQHVELNILLPLAISFFTFQQVAFLVDSYQGLCRERNFGRYLLFVSFLFF